MSSSVVAALFVDARGVYAALHGVDPWPEGRDARRYGGPLPVVAHPPCARWGRYWSGGPSRHGKYRLGDDGGCFAAALASVRTWGGVLEHPEASHAWRAFNIALPPRRGGWVPAGLYHPGAWTCCVEQGHYGHQAHKATWLYFQGDRPRDRPPALRWGTSGQRLRLEDGYHSAAERRRAVKTGRCQRLSSRQRAATPPEFARLLVGLARGSGVREVSA